MKNVALAAAIWLSASAAAQDRDLSQGVDLVAAVTGSLGDVPVFGAAIAFAREKDRLYLATANHVVRQSGRAAANLQVRLRRWPDKQLPATLLAQANLEMDVAVLTVDGLAANGVDVCALSFDRLAKAGDVERGTEVVPIGNPNGVPWTVPLRWDGVLEVREEQVLFESNRLARGHSGGALLGAGGELVGMIQADEPPDGRALGMPALVRVLHAWNIPVDLRETDEDGLPPLFNAVRRNDLDDARRLVGQACTNVKAALKSGETALHYAASLGRARIAKVLIDAGADVNARTGKGESPLGNAVSKGKLNTAGALIVHGADVNGTTPNGPPVALAAVKGNLEIMKLLLSHGADVNFRTADDTLLTFAAGGRKLEMVKLLLSYKADPNLTGSRSRTTAVMAAAAGYPVNSEILRALLAAGAKVNETNEYESSALLRAVDHEQVTAVRLLLDAGANVAVIDKGGQTPLGMIAGRSSSSEHTTHVLHDMAVALLEHANTIRTEDAQRLLLGNCVEEGWPDVTALIVKHGFPVRGEAGSEALSRATEHGWPEVVRVLLDAGADVNRAPASSPTRKPLQTAVWVKDPGKRFELVQLMIAKGARVNFHQSLEGSDTFREEPLYGAVLNEPHDLKTVELLIARGALVVPYLVSLARGKWPEVVPLLLKGHTSAAISQQ